MFSALSKFSAATTQVKAVPGWFALWETSTGRGTEAANPVPAPQSRGTKEGQINMKKLKLTALTLGGLLTLSLAFAGEPSAADQKWLSVVEKKIVEGQTQVSTPALERVTLVKEWAGKNGYAVQVTKIENSFQIDLSKSIASK
jgi:hypothetical protein